jgi:Domain of unknown function (DUF4345)
VAHPALRVTSTAFFFGYVLLLIGAGAWGVVLAQLDMRWLIGLKLGALGDETKANLLSQYRFLRALELGFGIFAVLHRHRIFGERLYNRLFLFVMGSGIAARLVGLAADGSPSPAMYVFLVTEAIGFVLIFAYTRATVAPA